jgi:hypothetical protein
MLLLLLACATPAPESAPAPSQEAQPVAQKQSHLARSLYALGPEVAPQAGRTRSLLWIREMQLQPAQVQALCDHSAQSQALWERHDAQLQSLKDQNAEALEPVLAPLEHQLLTGSITPEEARIHAQALDALALPDPLTLRGDTVRASVALAESLWPTLSGAQQGAMGSALFLLRDLDPGTRSTPPALPEPWSDGDFSTLRRSTPSADPSISALFELEDGNPISALSTSDHQILLAMVLLHPSTQSACEAMAPAPQE